MKKVYYTDKQIDGMIHEIVRQLVKDRWVPDYVVGLTRGGLVPALKISHYLDIRMETLKVRLRNGEDCETNCWMPEDAFGYIDSYKNNELHSRWDINQRKNILIIDDINDTGATFKWIKNDWQQSCFPLETYAWESIWHKNVKFAALIENSASDISVDYVAETINKTENDVWVEFPWENWWKGD